MKYKEIEKLAETETRSSEEIEKELDELYDKAQDLAYLKDIIKEKEISKKIENMEDDWIKSVEENRDKILDLTLEANEKIDEAIRISEKFAIPFNAHYLPRVQTYVPRSYRDRNIHKLDRELIQRLVFMNPPEHEYGWEVSGPPLR